ncbi:MAG TPA: MBL fold metallo-hydrolase [Vicinamibacterales bacterium]|nr:MBL fold metallo-hydrolase [Vicinamibacterales bacterium]
MVQIVLVLVTLIAGSNGPAYMQQRGPAPDPLVRENATVKVAAHTYVIPDNNVGLVPNVGIITGSRGTLVIDPGLGRRNGETVLKEAQKLSRSNVMYIASTHFHPEHTTGYVAFPASAKYVNSTLQETEFEQNGMQMVRTFANRSPVTADLLKDAARRPADITFDREYTLDLGDVHVRFIVVGPTHTRGDTGLFVVEDGVLFAGDVVMNQSFLAAGDATSMAAWLKAFETFDAMHPSTIVPSHGAIGTGDLIAANRTLMRSIRDRAVALKAQGKSIDETATAIQTEMTAAHPDWPRANGIAAAAKAAYNEAK